MKKKNTMRRLLRYLKKYWLLLILSLLFAALTVAMTLYLPILIGQAVDLIVAPGQVEFSTIARLLLKMGILIGATALSQWIMNACNNRITYRTVRDIRSDAFARLEILPLRYIDAHSYGEIVSRMIADVDQFADGLLMGFTQFFTGVLTIVGTLLFMLWMNPLITLVVVVITPVSLFVASFIARKTYAMFKEQSAARGEQTGIIDEMVGNQKVVQAFGYQDRAQGRFDEVNERLRKCSLRAIFFSSITNPSTRFVNSLVYAGVCVAGALSAVHGGISVGQLTSFLSYANQYTKPFNEISGVVTELQNALACADRIFELIEETPQTPEPADAKTLTDPDGSVALEDVSFSYVPEQHLIEHFDLAAKPGQRIAIVGPTGCGTTTIINLLMRFYDVDSGCIRVGGEDIRQLTRGSLRTSYGMVLQDTWLKTGTIRENIVMGKPDATDEEVIAAAKASHAHGFIRRLPQGCPQRGIVTAGVHHARHALPASDAHPRRGDVLHRHAHGDQDPGGLQPPDAGPHELHRRPSPLDHPRGRCHSGDERRPHHRAGQPQDPAGEKRLLCRAVPQPVRYLKKPCPAGASAPAGRFLCLDRRIVEIYVPAVEVLAQLLDRLAEALEMHDLPRAEEADDVVHIRIVRQAQNVVIG